VDEINLMFDDLRKAIKATQSNDPMQEMMVMAGLGLLQQLLTDINRSASALEAIAMNMEESNPTGNIDPTTFKVGNSA
jgi:hypothetical protein